MSTLLDFIHLASAAPSLVLGILIGVFGYRYMLKKNPTMLSKLVSIASADVQGAVKLVLDATSVTQTNSSK